MTAVEPITRRVRLPVLEVHLAQLIPRLRDQFHCIAPHLAGRRDAETLVGMTVDQVQQRFSDAGWELVNAERSVLKPMVIRRADDLFELWHYQLVRTSS
jgi:hypothetical protein